jgi:hypothetical protein
MGSPAHTPRCCWTPRRCCGTAAAAEAGALLRHPSWFTCGRGEARLPPEAGSTHATCTGN